MGKTRNSDAIAYLDSYVFSAKAVAETRVQFSRLSPAVVATGGNNPPVVLIGINDPLKLVTGACEDGFYRQHWARASADSFDGAPVTNRPM